MAYFRSACQVLLSLDGATIAVSPWNQFRYWHLVVIEELHIVCQGCLSPSWCLITTSILFWYIVGSFLVKLFHLQLTCKLETESRTLAWALQSSIPLKWKGLFLSSVTVTWTEEKAFAKALKLELIHGPTADDSFLFELLTYSTYCDNFTTTIARVKAAGF